MSNIKDVKVAIPWEHGEELVKRHLVAAVRPDWKSDDIVAEVLKGGYVNSLIAYRRKSDVTNADAIVVRAQALDSDRPPRDVGTQVALLLLAHHAGCSPAPLASFQNGVVYEYVHGRHVTGEEYADPKIARLIARCLAQLHHTDPNQLHLVENEGNKSHVPSDFIFFSDMRDGSLALRSVDPDSDIGKRVREELPDAEVFEREINYIETMLANLGLSCALCHRDVHGRNLIYDEHTGKMSLIDFDNVGRTFVAFEFAHFFNLHWASAILPDFPTGKGPLSDDQMLLYVQCYVERMGELEGRGDGAVKQQNIDHLWAEVKIMNLVMPFLYIMCGTCMESIAGFVRIFPAYHLYMDIYLEKKKHLKELCDDYQTFRIA